MTREFEDLEARYDRAIPPDEKARAIADLEHARDGLRRAEARVRLIEAGALGRAAVLVNDLLGGGGQ